jgi:Flp pilus assembly protein TadD
MVIDYYALINVSPTISDADLKTALYAALRQWTNRQNHRQLEKRQEAERNVAHLEDAKKVLLDPAKRAQYNKILAKAADEQRPAEHNQVPAGNLIEAGWRYLQDGNVAEALYVATKATQQQGDNPAAWALLAQAKFRWGDTEDAIYEYKRAIQLRPNEASYYFDLGSVYETEHQYDHALQQYSRAVKIDPKTAMYRAAVGAVLCKEDNYSEGIPILERCVAEDPENSGFGWFLAVAYVNSAQLNWTYVPNGNSLGVPEGHYATTREQVIQAQRQLAKAAALKFDDEELASHIRAVRTDIDSMMGRKFQGSVMVPIVGGIIYSFFYGIGIVFALLYFVASRPPQYALNKYVLKGGLNTADAELSNTFSREGVGGGLFMSAIYGLFLPIMVLVNFVRYYTGDNATPSG